MIAVFFSNRFFVLILEKYVYLQCIFEKLIYNSNTIPEILAETTGLYQ